MFYQWVEDSSEQVELFKHHGYLIGSFLNPEAVKSIIGGKEKIEIPDEEVEKTAQMIREQTLKDLAEKENPRKKRRRRKAK